MFIHNFEFRKALKVAKKVKEKKPDMDWLEDYVILHRERYLKEVGADKENDELFKELHPKRTFEDIKNLKASMN